VLEMIGEDAVPTLTGAMLYGDREAALNAAATLAYIGQDSASAVQPFIDQLDKQDLQAVAANYLFFIAFGKQGSEQVIADALLKYGKKQMALDCLNCGNDTLDAAGRKWASKHGYYVYNKKRGDSEPALPWGVK
jgi:hypothetical protein